MIVIDAPDSGCDVPFWGDFFSQKRLKRQMT